MLGLNCGFGNAEVASLLVGEVHLFQGHSPHDQEQLRYRTTDDDSFIKRIRRKTGVYGEHILFPMTVQGMEWALQQRQQFADYSPEARLILNANGKAFDTPTKKGNRNQQIPNRFARLIKRIQDDDNEIRKLSFNKLRKTAGNLIRQHSDGEVMGVFHCRGTPVKKDDESDDYSNRPFGRVFQAIRDVQEYLAPVFREAGRAPFAPQAQAYTNRSVIDRIIELHEAGCFPGHIASEVRLSTQAVSGHILRYEEQNRAPDSSMVVTP